jgi:PAS domain S-box-containing protein
VFRIKDGAFQQWNVDNGLSSAAVLWITEDPEGVMWAGLQTGIARIKNGQARMINRSHGLYDNYVYAIVPDDAGNLWANSGRGIFSVSRNQMNAVADGSSSQLESTPYDGLEAIKTTDVTSVESSGCKTSDGRIWFPCPQGVVMIDPKNLQRNLVRPPVRLQGVRLHGVDISVDKLPPLPPGPRDLEFRYTALSYIAPQKIQFRYQLAGYDASWVSAGTRRSAFYTNLKPGLYQFWVQACNADGVWNTQGAQIELELRPYYFQTRWFKWLCGLTAVVALFGVTAWRVKHVQNRGKNLQAANDLLESKVGERTRELAVANVALRGEIDAHKQVQARLQDEITERVKSDRALADQRNLLRTLIDNLPDNVFVKDRESRVILDNLAHAHFVGAKSPEEAVGKTHLELFPRELADKFYTDEQKLMASGEIFNGEEKILDPVTHQSRWLRTTKVPLRDGEGRIIGLAGINRDITERKESEAKLEALHLELVEASRHAGKAEVAVGVLHNVGNVLNSVNVSTTIIAEKIRGSGARQIAEVAALLRAHQGDLPGYAAAKGEQLTAFLETLSDHVTAERGELLKEVASLRQNVEHIKEIVAMQQAYARVSGVFERIQISEVVEDALRMHSLAYQRHSITLCREFGKVPVMTLDRHKTLQILVNLLSNAKHACDAKPPADRKVTVRLEMSGASRVKIGVADSGVGIPAANLQRIFNYGFTTRKSGHGFGLHSGALAAKEMGGHLTVASPGPGQGATFTLELPLEAKSSSQHDPPTPRSASGNHGELPVAGAWHPAG